MNVVTSCSRKCEDLGVHDCINTRRVECLSLVARINEANSYTIFTKIKPKRSINSPD